MQREFELKCSSCHSFHFIGVKLKTEEVVCALCLFVRVPWIMKDSGIQSKSVSDFLVTDRTREVGPTSYKDLRVLHSINSVVLE